MNKKDQLAHFGESLYTKTFKCSKCKEVSSVIMLDGSHLCLKHYLQIFKDVVDKPKTR